MFRRLRHMLVKEFLEMLRDPRMRAVVFVMPVVQMTILAFALTTDVKEVRTAVVDPDNSPESREVIAEFSAGGYFDIRYILRSDSELRRLLDSGKVMAVVRFPTGFSGDVRAGRPVKVQFIADGTMSNDAAIATGYAMQIAAWCNERLLRERSAAAGGPFAKVELELRAWHNPNLESKYYYVPGLIAVMLLVVSMLLTSMAIVREKEIGTIEQVMVTPIRRYEFILGKTLPFLVTGYITMTLMFIIAAAVFGIRVQGSILLLYLLAGVYVAGNLGLALLVSVSARTQQQALLTGFFFMLPGVLLSGFIFPIRNMPEAVQWVTMLNPMRWFLEILHGIVVRGVGMEILWPAACAQAALAAGFIVFAVERFKKTLE